MAAKEFDVCGLGNSLVDILLELTRRPCSTPSGTTSRGW
jgi:hypothetical protein